VSTDFVANERIRGVLAEYGLLLDEDRLEDWVALFTDDCDYRIVARENVEQGLPNVLVWCKGKSMLADRITSYRHVNEYNLHWARRVIGPARIRSGGQDAWQVEASYSVFQTNLEGVTRLFSVGRYEMQVVASADRAILKSVRVIADTASIPTLLAAPI
jgi:anthranilate 1,2-dioxygenase small subunit